MASLVIEGETLIEKYRNYNKIFNETKQERVDDINYDDPDFENFFKIDVACKNRDLEFVLRVLQSEDMVYVSRALKRCAWLVTDERHRHVIHPVHLHRQLQPHMMPRAFNKLLLHIRLNLKDEALAEEFFNYYFKDDFYLALKWLHLCSVAFTENILEDHVSAIPEHMMKRICEKSVSLLEIFARKSETHYKRPVFSATKYHLKRNTEKYLDIIESMEDVQMPRFRRRLTKFLMKEQPERIFKNLDRYCAALNTEAFAKSIRPDDMKSFILSKNENIRIMGVFFIKKYVGVFVRRLPVEIRFELIRKMFIGRHIREIDTRPGFYYSFRRDKNISTSENIYFWYKYAPFEIAIEDLKKLIRSESDPSERAAMFDVLLQAAGDEKNIHTVLKHYRQYHANEPTNFKSKFIESILVHTKWHKFDKATWKYLNDLFISLKSDSDKADQSYIRAIILYNVIHDEKIKESTEQKFEFNTFKSYLNKITEAEKDKLFTYLYNYLTSKIDNNIINDEKECNETVQLLQEMLNLLCDWKKELQDFSFILQKIKDIIRLKSVNKWDMNLVKLLNTKKSWKKYFFSESFLWNPTQEACINALKFRPELLIQYNTEVEAICLNDKEPLDRFMRYLRTFWPQSLAKTYKALLMNHLEDKSKQKAVTKNLFTLLPISQVLNIALKYAPIDAKIDRTTSDSVISLRKNIAMNLRFARPLPSPETILLYAKDDYLRYAMPSIRAVFDESSITRVRKFVPDLVNAPTRLQKYGILVALDKLEPDDMKKYFSVAWETNKSKSIRAQIFINIFEFLYSSNDKEALGEMWNLLSVLIDDLTSEENKMIYKKMSETEWVHMSVKPKVFMKCYKFLESMPPAADCGGLLSDLMNKIYDVLEFLDNDFMADLFFKSFDENFSTGLYKFQHLVAISLLSTRTEEAHIARYNKILVPILERSFAMWDKTHNGVRYVEGNLLGIFKYLDENFNSTIWSGRMFIPIPMYTDIIKLLETNLDADEYYVIIKPRKIALECAKVYYDLLKTDSSMTEDERYEKFPQLLDSSLSKIGGIFMNNLKEDLDAYFPSIYILYAEAFQNIIYLYFDRLLVTKIFKTLLDYRDFIYGHLFLMKAIIHYSFNDDEKDLKKELAKELCVHPSMEVRRHCREFQNALDY